MQAAIKGKYRPAQRAKPKTRQSGQQQKATAYRCYRSRVRPSSCQKAHRLLKKWKKATKVAMKPPSRRPGKDGAFQPNTSFTAKPKAHCSTNPATTRRSMLREFTRHRGNSSETEMEMQPPSSTGTTAKSQSKFRPQSSSTGQRIVDRLLTLGCIVSRPGVDSVNAGLTSGKKGSTSRS